MSNLNIEKFKRLCTHRNEEAWQVWKQWLQRMSATRMNVLKHWNLLQRDHSISCQTRREVKLCYAVELGSLDITGALLNLLRTGGFSTFLCQGHSLWLLLSWTSSFTLTLPVSNFLGQNIPYSKSLYRRWNYYIWFKVVIVIISITMINL